MTRLFTDGAEMGDTLSFDLTIATSVSTVHKTGVYGYSIGDGYARKYIPASSEIYVRWNLAVAPITDYPGVTILQWMKGGTALGSVRWNSTTHVLYLYTGDSTLVGTSTVLVHANTWYLIELRIKIDNSSGALQLKINNDTAITFSGDTQPGADTTIDTVNFVSAEYLGETIDDIAINNTAGAVDNSWCGDGHVVLLSPNAVGDSSQLIPSSGSTNYLMVDEIPADNDTTYVSGSVANSEDLYNLSSSASGVEILRVWGEGRAKDSTTGSGIVQVLLKTESTEYSSANIMLTTNYAPISGSVYTVNPSSGSAWTATQLDALQVGVKIIQ
jgi:hypothetical protein